MEQNKYVAGLSKTVCDKYKAARKNARKHVTIAQEKIRLGLTEAGRGHNRGRFGGTVSKGIWTALACPMRILIIRTNGD